MIQPRRNTRRWGCECSVGSLQLNFAEVSGTSLCRWRAAKITLVDRDPFNSKNNAVRTMRLETCPSAEHHAHSRNRGASEVVPMAPADRPGGVTNRRNILSQQGCIHLRVPAGADITGEGRALRFRRTFRLVTLMSGVLVPI